MKTKIIEATNGPLNWGKFMVCQFDQEEWDRRPQAPGCESLRPLLREIGWDNNFIWVLDLQTGEGALFRRGGSATVDLNKHQIWVCPLYEPFLTWLYKNFKDLDSLPEHVDMPDAEFALSGYRRPGQTTSETPPESAQSDQGGKQ